MSTTCVFLVQLEQNYYYVGESIDPIKRLEELREGLGPAWTNYHKPIGIIETHPFKQVTDLDVYTKLYMRKYGFDRVRGGSFQDVVLRADQQAAIHEDLQNCIIA